MNNESYRDTWTEISLSAIYENTHTFKNHISKRTKLMAVVKADGYGHGAVEVSNTALKAGADYLGVAILDEAIALREAGISAPILVLGYTPIRSIETAVQNNISLTVYSMEVLKKVNTISSKLNKITKIHIKVDTGMGRVGVTSKEEALSLAEMAEEAPYVHLEGLFTHFANADSNDDNYTDQQFSSFQNVIRYLKNHHIEIPIKHCCNSAATICNQNMHLDMVRVGISLYGLYPSNDVKNTGFPLKQAMHFKTKVSAVKQVPAGRMISYGCTFSTDKTTNIATIPVGYADGLSRLLSNKGQFLIKNKQVPIIGRICMDQTMLDVTHLPTIDTETEVTIFGSSDTSFISIDEVADHMGTINYEVVCLIGKRVPRVYLKTAGRKPLTNANAVLV
ncbi:alanine racemase [Anaerobacillus arseniciselenatis]|uniref:Alanine racemase n=1 Tax=Anaerobacillus arseniciselenatis TaxID=85682 RepID=A0A1S2L8D4_9BACI|nr:alanine racemase [Anaerobacillus arseniciselenatis]OIJ08530.1 alanine racemase [Anaerobacillus arseniciselenatis]